MPLYYLCITSKRPMWPALRTMPGRATGALGGFPRHSRCYCRGNHRGRVTGRRPIALVLMQRADEMERSDALSHPG
jgi:hypothetical protein